MSMTLEAVKAAVEVIRSVARDDEDAHGREDQLHAEVLAEIASGDCSNPAELAKEALKTLDIKFARWCA